MRLTETKIEANPPCNKAAVEVSMCDDDYVTRALALFLPEAVVLTDLHF